MYIKNLNRCYGNKAENICMFFFGTFETIAHVQAQSKNMRSYRRGSLFAVPE